MGESVKKGKLISSICLGLLCISMLVVGVFAAVQASYNLSADVNFNPNGVFVEMSGQIYRGASYDTLEPIYEDATYTLKTCKNYRVLDESSSANEPFQNINVSAWNFSSVKFFPQHRWIQVRLTIKNMGKENISVIPTTDLSITNITVYEESSDTLLIEPGETKEYKLNLKLNDSVNTTISNTTFSMPLDIRNTSDIENPASNFTMNTTTTTQLDSISSSYSNPVYAKRVVVVPTSLGATSTKAGSNSSYAFQNLTTSTKYLILPKGLTNIGAYSVYNKTGINGAVIPSSVTTIGDYAFGTCFSLHSISIPGSVTTVGNYAFTTCTSLLSAVVQQGAVVLGSQCFYKCTFLAIVSFGGTSLGSSCFSGCTALASVEVIGNLTTIDNFVFSECSSLSSLILPSSVTSINSSAFTKCSSLEIEVDDSNSNFCSVNGSLYNKDKTNILRASAKITSFVIPDGVKKISAYAFTSCSVTSIESPSSVTTIGEYAFAYCPKLNLVNILGNVTIINTGTFGECKALTTINLPNSVTGIGHNAFYGCSSLTEITIPANVTQMGHTVFSGCTKLKTVYMLGDAPKIYPDTFGYSTSGSHAAPYTNSGFNINTGDNVTYTVYATGLTAGVCAENNWAYYYGNNKVDI